uniref:EGF-like domain-containing protein n=1 Tax=Chromera velia CCMP2878 TaxID=1169474 RepID=A0A0G4I349_9ALVE|eukprot:Cvel_10514.t1-p1 / transcript=Cvel_10514.t1 / gene=Cvel_10514 / organism=Chromera_velia_CCMP2878 / gene_product=Uromodulin, putative / transcript_product=Uromodulin, putative / location=Cvel_scaffold636:7642-13596(+) / protein_length=529 / sequence_SO=supercontig / SO=protein_coding / is_pseudo=false
MPQKSDLQPLVFDPVSFDMWWRETIRREYRTRDLMKKKYAHCKWTQPITTLYPFDGSHQISYNVLASSLRNSFPPVPGAHAATAARPLTAAPGATEQQSHIPRPPPTRPMTTAGPGRAPTGASPRTRRIQTVSTARGPKTGGVLYLGGEPYVEATEQCAKDACEPVCADFRDSRMWNFRKQIRDPRLKLDVDYQGNARRSSEEYRRKWGGDKVLLSHEVPRFHATGSGPVQTFWAQPEAQYYDPVFLRNHPSFKQEPSPEALQASYLPPQFRRSGAVTARIRSRRCGGRRMHGEDETQAQSRPLCVDIDECMHPSLNDCDENAFCVNTEGSFECICQEGFAGTGVRCSGLMQTLRTLCNATLVFDSDTFRLFACQTWNPEIAETMDRLSLEEFEQRGSGRRLQQSEGGSCPSPLSFTPFEGTLEDYVKRVRPDDARDGDGRATGVDVQQQTNSRLSQQGAVQQAAIDPPPCAMTGGDPPCPVPYPSGGSGGDSGGGVVSGGTAGDATFAPFSATVKCEATAVVLLPSTG